MEQPASTASSSRRRAMGKDERWGSPTLLACLAVSRYDRPPSPGAHVTLKTPICRVQHDDDSSVTAGSAGPVGGGRDLSGQQTLTDLTPRWLQRGIVVVLAGLLLAALFLRARLVTTLNINWDEFYFLSRIHTYLRGDLGDRLLTFHVHLFSWVPSTSTSEIDQVFVLRAIMFGCGVVTAAAITWLGRCVLGSLAAGLFASVAYASFSLVLQFGNSARFDPPIVALFLVASALIVSERRRLLFVAGALCAVGVLMSIKFALYLPTLAALFVARGLAGSQWRTVLREVLSFAAVMVVVAGALGAFHVGTLAPTLVGASGAAGLPTAGLGAIVTKVADAAWSFPQEETLRITLGWDRAFWIFFIIGLVITSVTLVAPGRSRTARAQALMLVSFAVPLLTLSFYRNAFPYFYVTVIPPASLLAGAFFGWVQQLTWTRMKGVAAATVVAGVATVGMASPLAWAAWRWFDANQLDQVADQRLTLDVIHQVFPQPVPYIDRCGMVSSFPKVGFFMSTWTIEDYRQQAVPLMADVLVQQQPHFLLANVRSLDLHQGKIEVDDSFHALLPDDFALLRDNFVPHWGPLWVAGKRVVIDDATIPVVTDLVIAGRYLVEAPGTVFIDGVGHRAGDVVDMVRGTHSVAGDVGTVVLRIADARPAPTVAPPKDDLFRRFKYLRRQPRSRR